MKKMLLALCALIAFGASAITIPPETYSFRINYHLGFINKTAGYGEVKICADNDTFHGDLHGASINWNGRVYSVTDTLVARMTPSDSSPLDRETVVKRAGWYFKPLYSQLESGQFDKALPANHKTINGGGTLDASDATMEAVNITSNMLAMFYYFRQIPFPELSAGHTYHIVIDDPANPGDYVDIGYEGLSQYNWLGNKVPTYKIVFEYSYRGTSSNYPVTCQVSRDTRLPLLFEASLPIGRLQMILEGNK